MSTASYGHSGLGLEAQRAAVQNFLRGDTQLVATGTEVESGRNNERPQLVAAIAWDWQEVLLVAKLDRLAHNVVFLATLLDSRVRFQAVDLPAADEFTLHIMAVMAQKDALAISTRTHDVLAARGAQLGTPAKECGQWWNYFCRCGVTN